MKIDFASIFSKKFQKYSAIFPKTRGAATAAPHTLPQKPRLAPGHPAFIGLRIHQYDIRPDAADAAPGDHKILPPAPQSEKAAGAGDDDGNDIPLRHLHPHVGDEPQPPPVTDADDLLALQLRKLNRHTLPLPYGF